ncbi:hypothetical protein GGF31_003098 [Allomyces arbusculus]|nr:hypothetical protein GGF31_003098 [Allomyces arbusculus]
MARLDQQRQRERVFASAVFLATFMHTLAFVLALAIQPAMADSGPSSSTPWSSPVPSPTITGSSTSITTAWGTSSVASMHGLTTPSSTFPFNSWDSDFNKAANSVMTAITMSMVIGGLVFLCAIVAVIMWIMRRRRFDQPLSQAPVTPPPNWTPPVPAGPKPETTRYPTGASSLATAGGPSPLYSTDPRPEEAVIRPPAPTATAEWDAAAGNGAWPTQQQPARNGQTRVVIDPDPVYLPPAPVDQEPLYLPARAQPLTAVNRPSLHRSSSI